MTFSLSKPFKPNSLKTQTKPLSVISELATIPVLSFTGDKIGKTQLELKSAPPDIAHAVVHLGIITDLQNKRRGIASTLTHAEVRGGGKKPYSQKKKKKTPKALNLHHRSYTPALPWVSPSLSPTLNLTQDTDRAD
ncbi:hypothetical protein ACB092_06G231600 [Castanea dentata]